ncbi:hypothetical protein A3F28_03250 [Candidatus Uhrbacteria bacterium RIFCSPHIGHO2_12_FULL_57_11]|uniref:Uncharacterized protein n=1 Tax=Candidatus Uhrbacteria bacterium RIFCSPHIGHO2_12_FULL_57_11 TaxID=1802398 RepID=A0A1F7UG16_9BACT|nr:MAG: hypothetical protein A3F28_03250 [Candidatus Uhrbacteria bacterium RIFCSPHIGHO2_12_FULL_57_11]
METKAPKLSCPPVFGPLVMSVKKKRGPLLAAAGSGSGSGTGAGAAGAAPARFLSSLMLALPYVSADEL